MDAFFNNQDIAIQVSNISKESSIAKPLEMNCAIIG